MFTWSHLAAFAANFSFIGLKAFQQRNVIHGNKVAVVVTSHLLAATEILVVWKIARTEPDFSEYLALFITLGMSGGLGCLLAMTLHDKYFKRSKV